MCGANIASASPLCDTSPLAAVPSRVARNWQGSRRRSHGRGRECLRRASTQYDAFPVESPDPGVNSRFAERLSEGAADLTGDGVRDVFASTWVQNVPTSEIVSGGAIADNHAGRLSLIDGATRKVVWTKTPEPQGPGLNEFGPTPPAGTGQGERGGGIFGFLHLRGG